MVAGVENASQGLQMMEGIAKAASQKGGLNLIKY
jgi:hypothetical protein